MPKAKNIPFRFQHVWTEHPNFLDVVKDVWQEQITGSPMFRIAKKRQILKKKLKVWNKIIFENVDRNVALAIIELAKGCSMNNDLFNLIPYMVDLADNNFLEAVPSPLEIKDTKYDICRAIRNFFIDGCIPKALSKFRPICMGNFIFKSIPKILANRLRVIAPKLISEEVDAFLKGRHISSNICMASKLLNSFPKKSHGGYLLKTFGFTVKFVCWIKQILHSTNILEERGLSQGIANWVQKKMICILKGPRGTICYQNIVGSLYWTLTFQYLGVPIFFGVPKARLLRPLLESIHNKLLSWKGKILISLDKVCKPINKSGLGISRLRDVNLSILMKLFIFAKYFKEDSSVRSTPQVSSVRPGILKNVWVGNTSLASQSGLPLSTFKNSKARVSHFISGLTLHLRHPSQSFSMSWKVANNAIVIDKKVRSIVIPLASCFSLCGNGIETRDHLFVIVVLLIACGARLILMETNYLAELNAFIYGAEYAIRKGFTNVWIEFFIVTGYAVGDNIENFVLHYSIVM
ncbi:hypothetical protein AMTRI_Chr01g129030 [Amborella trichopoda]